MLSDSITTDCANADPAPNIEATDAAAIPKVIRMAEWLVPLSNLRRRLMLRSESVVASMDE